MLEFLTSILGATIKSLATKALSGPLEKLARKALRKVDAQPLESATAKVDAAVEAAREELVNEVWAGEEELGREVVELLRHPPFTEEVARRLLFRGQTDVHRLRRTYLDREGNTAAAEERWPSLEIPLAVFFEAIEQQLEVDAELGPLLRDARRLAATTSAAEAQRDLLATSRRLQTAQLRTARATETGSQHLGQLLAEAGEQTVMLGQIAELLERSLQRPAAGPGPDAGAEPLLPAEQAYLRLLCDECNRLPLADDARDIAPETGDRPSLANVYIDLETTAEPTLDQVLHRLGVGPGKRPALLAALENLAEAAPDSRDGRQLAAAGLPAGALLGKAGEELPDDHPLRPWAADAETLAAARRPLAALEALVDSRHLVLLGDPGSGKSTFVNHLAGSLAHGLLAAHGCEAPAPAASAPDAAAPPEGLGEAVFPVRVVLRQWSAGLGSRQGRGREQSLELVFAALAQLAADISRERWVERFGEPHTLVLFDGLDEVPAGGEAGAGDRRRRIVDAVEAFRIAHPACRVLVTSRVKPYRDAAYQLAGATTCELAPLDDARIRSFSERWYGELARVGRLRGAEAEVRRERLLRALQDRRRLREMAGTPLLLTMLAQVNARKVLPDSRAELYGECIEQLLWEWERRKSESGGVESLAQLLEEPRGGLALADFERVLWRLTYEVHGASGKDGTADLAADALRKALAGIHPQPHQGWAWADRVVELMRLRGGLLIETAPGVFTFPHRSFQEYLACRWLLARGNAASTARELAVDDAWPEVVLLACGYLASQGDFDDLQAILAELVAEEEPPEPAGWRRLLVAGRAWREFGAHRAQGGTGKRLEARMPELLTRLMQHPDLPPAQRLEAGLIAADLGALPDDLDSWVEVAGGELGYDLRIGRYPVTNAQFRRFVEAGGYERGNGWFSDEAEKEILEFERLVAQGEWPTGPRFEQDPSLNSATQPVTGVSWYEAQAYAAWLTAKLRKAGDIGDDEAVRLPTPAEWQLAASGPGGHEYPWGGPADPRWANTNESRLGRPTPVHMYPAGTTPEGALDLCGNVWEWTNEESGQLAVLAGGSWYNTINTANTAARHRDYRRADIVGFRLVVVPISRL